ncbi:MAG TPA: hypothetical protein VEM34_04795 [Burkholderiales bacterium]|nr:hypothetical protein [Burkholderiales bacterium]
MSSSARYTHPRTPVPGHRRWFAAGLVTFLLSAPAAGQDDELARVREEAAVLRQSLDRVEARIRVLEGSVGAASASSGYSKSIDALASLKRGWSQVAPGLPEVKVEALLGRPEKVLRIDNTLVWYYIYPEIGRGSVFFNASGKVSSRQAPGVGW